MPPLCAKHNGCSPPDWAPRGMAESRAFGLELHPKVIDRDTQLKLLHLVECRSCSHVVVSRASVRGSMAALEQ